MKQQEAILEGVMAERAKAVVSQIAKALTPAAEQLTPEHLAWHGGKPAELALFYGCLAEATGRAEYRAQAVRFVELAVGLFRANAGLGLHGGLAGLA